jgi:hypothetical protein
MKISTIFALLALVGWMIGLIGAVIGAISKPVYDAFEEHHTQEMDKKINWMSSNLCEICFMSSVGFSGSMAILWIIALAGGH